MRPFELVAHCEFSARRRPELAYYELELMRLKWSVRGDVRMFIGTVARMIHREKLSRGT